MSNRLVIELPEGNLLTTVGSMMMSIATIFGVIGSLIILSVLVSPDTPVVVKTSVIAAIILATVVGCRKVMQAITQNRWKRAEYALKESIKQLGYVALEPIEIKGNRARALLKDHYEPALWEVNVDRNKVICNKIPAIQRPVDSL